MFISTADKVPRKSSLAELQIVFQIINVKVAYSFFNFPTDSTITKDTASDEAMSEFKNLMMWTQRVGIAF